MAGNIKGITIELNGDSTKLTSAIDGVKRQSIGLQSELKEIDKLLKFSPGNSDLIAQKQQNLGRQIEATAQKLDVLKQAQQQVEAQFRSGTLSEEKYNAFQREVINTEMALKNYKVQLETVNTSQQELQSKTKQLETLFQATGTSVDQYASAIGVNLLQAIKSGTASSAQLDQAIEKIGKAALGSEIDVEKMKQALATVDDGASLDSIRQDLSRVAQEANQAETEVNSFGDTIKAVVAGLATGGGIATVVSQALDVSSLNTKIDITFDVPEESKASVRNAVKGVEAYGVDAEAALEGVRRQWALNKNASDESNSAIIEGAGVIASSYAGVDFTELIQETNELAAGLKISNEDALALTNALLKAGFPPEQLDTLAEYGLQMKQAGYSTAEIQAIFSQGIDTKSWNIDNLNDGVKEARIQMASFGQEVPKSLGDLLSKTDVSSKKFQQWGKDVADGGKKGSVAMSEMADWLGNIKDKSLQNAIATQVFGTKWEDQGPNMIAILEGLGDAQDKTKENQDELNSATEKMKADPAVQMKQAMVDIQTAVAPLLVSIAEIVGSIAKWVSQNSTLAGVIATVVAGVGLVVGIFMALAPIVMTISTIIGGVGAAFGAMILPVLAVIAAVAAFVALGIAVYKNWDGISEFFVNLWESIKTIFTTSITAIGEFLSTVWDGMVTIIKTVWDGIKLYFTTVLNIYKLIFTTVWNAIKTAVTVVWNAIKTTATTVFNGIKLYFTTVLNIYKTIFTTVWNAIKTVVTTIWNGIKTKATTVFNAIKSTITTIFNAIKSVSTTVWNSIKSVISTVINGIKTVITTVFNAVSSVVTTIWNGIKATSSSVWNSIKSVVSSAVNGIRSVVTTVFNAVRSVVSSVMSTVKSVISSTWNGAKSIVSSAVNSIKSTVSNVFNALKGVVSTAMSGVKSAIESGWNKAKGFLEGINLVSIGKNIIEGLINGIKGAAGKVASAIKGVADGAVNAAKKALGIHSPSRVMRDQVGKHITDGIAVGISKNKSAENAAKKKAQVIKQAFTDQLKNLDTKYGVGMINTDKYVSELKKLKSTYGGSVKGASLTVDAKVSKANTKEAKAQQQKRQKEQAALAKKFNNTMTKYANQYSAGVLSNTQYVKKLESIKKTYKNVTNAVSKIDSTVAKTRKTAYSNEVKELDNKLKANKISNTKYIAELQKVQKKYKDVQGAKSAIDTKIATAQNHISKQTTANYKKELKELDNKLKANKIGNEEYIKQLEKLKKTYARVEGAKSEIDVKITNTKEKILKEQYENDKAYYKAKSENAETSMEEELEILNTLAKGYKKNSEQRAYFEDLALKKTEEITEAKEKANQTYIDNVTELEEDYLKSYEDLTAKYTDAVEKRTDALKNAFNLFDEVKLSEGVDASQLLSNLEQQNSTIENWMSNLAQLASRGLDDGLIAELQEMGPKSAAEIAALTTLSDEQLSQYATLWKKKSELARTQAVQELEYLREDTEKQIEALQEETAKKLEGYQQDWKSSMSKIVGNTKAELSVMPSVGANAVQGLINGINSKKEELRRAAAELASIVSGTTQTELDIHSPSRVMRKLGEYTNEGFLVGLQRTAAKVQNAMQGVYGSVTKSVGTMQGSSTVTNSSSSYDNSKTYNPSVTVINHATNASPAEIARKAVQAQRRMAIEWGV